MARALMIYADSDRSMDLFHAIPRAITDPFLYVEHEGRRVAVVGHIDVQTIHETDPAVEILDPFALGRKALLEAGMDYWSGDFEVCARAVAKLGIREALVSWDFPAAVADRLRADGVDVLVDHRAFQARRRVKKGHRQELTVLRIADIKFNGKSAAEQVRKAEADAKSERQRVEEAAAKQAAADAALAAKLQQRDTKAADEAPKKGRASAKPEAKAASTAKAAPKTSRAKAADTKSDTKKPDTKPASRPRAKKDE